MADDKVILWGIGTMRTHRPQWLARELGIDYELKPIQPRTGETRTPEYLALNPRHKVPLLCHGELVLSESAAILSYLTEAFEVPGEFYLPADRVARAKLGEWCFFIISELDANGLYTMRRHGDLKAIYGDAPVAVDAGRDYFLHQLETMEGRIRGAGDYLMGARISIADILMVSCLDWARLYRISLPDYLLAYQRKLGSRPAYIQSFKENYPDLTVDAVR